MDYTKLAGEFLSSRLKIQQQDASKTLSQLMKGELFAMNYLLEHNKMAYPKEISDYMQVSTARIATILKHLEAEGKITRQTDTKDSRYVIVKLTSQGENDILDKRMRILKGFAKVFEYMGEENVREFLRLNKLVLEAYKNVEIKL